MRLNRFLASTLFTGLFVSTAVFSPAQGQERSLQPQGSWAVTKVDRSAQGGNSYCTLSRKYDDGVVLSLGRNLAEEYSLAIDFQKEVFSRDKALKINLQPGPGQIRAYDMMPTSERALVVRLGWDSGFFDALNKSQQIKVKIADQNYAFAMPEISKGQTELQDCMEGLKVAAGGAAATGAQSKDVLTAQAGVTAKGFDAAKAGEGSDSAGAINAQKQQLADAEKGAVNNFAASMSAQEAEASESAAPRKNFGKSVKTEEPDVVETSKKSPAPPPPVADKEEPKIAAANDAAKTAEVPPAEKPPVIKTAELVRRPSAPAPVPSKPDAKEPTVAALAATAPAADAARASIEIKTMEQNIADLKAENASLKQKAGGASAADAELQKQIDALQSEKKTLQDQISALKVGDARKAGDAQKTSEEITKLEARANELEIKNKQLEDSLRQSQTRIAETAINTETKSLKQIVDLQAKLEAAQKDNTSLAKQLESFKVRAEDKSLAVVAGDWDLEQATKRYNEAEREIRRLGQQLEQERMSCNREKAEIEQMLFDPAVASQKQIEKLSQLEKDLDDANAKIADSTKLVQGEIDRQLAARTQAMEAEKTALTQKVATLEKSLAEKGSATPDQTGLAQQVATLQKSLADKDAAIAAEKTAMHTRIATLEKTAKDAQAAGAGQNAMTQQIASLQKSLDEQKALATTEKAALQNQVAALQKDVTAKSAGASQERVALQSQLDAMKATLTQKDQEIAGLKAQPKIDPAAADQRVAQEVSKAKATADQEMATLKSQNLTVTQNLEKMKAEMAVKEKQLADAQYAAKTGAVNTQQLTDLMTSVETIKKDNASLRDQLIVARQDADKYRLQLVDVQSSGATRADQVASLQLALDGMKREMEMKDRASATYQNQLATIQQDNAVLKARLSVADTDRSNSTNEVGDLTRQVQSLQKQVGDLQRQKAIPVSAPERSASAGGRYDSIAPSAGYVSAAALPAIAQPVAAVSPSAGSMGGYDRASIQSLLQKSGLNVNGVRPATGFSGADNFGWTDSSNVKGLASVKMMKGGFEGMVNDYIAYQKTQCGGDFASMPSPSNGAGKAMALYEVACVGSNAQSTSSSLIFFEDQGRFIAISNEIDAANMDIAMDSRDKIATLVRGL